MNIIVERVHNVSRIKSYKRVKIKNMNYQSTEDLIYAYLKHYYNVLMSVLISHTGQITHNKSLS